MSIDQGEIWLVNFDPSIGNEIQKSRPCVVINDDALGRFGLKIVVPITGWKNHYIDYPWLIKIDKDQINGLTKTSAFDCFQIKSFSTKRFIKKIGNLDLDAIVIIHKTVAKTLNPKYKIIF